MAISTLDYEGYPPEAYHRRVGLIGKGPREENITKLTTTQTGVIKLSPLDFPEAFTWTPLLIPFENINDDADFMPDNRMIDSLQQVIERVPIVTGRLERIDGTPLSLEGPNSPLQVRVGASSVWYTSTQLRGSFQDLKEKGFSHEQLDPAFLFRAANDAVLEGKDYPLLTAKVGRFDCGSVVLLVTACHLIVDARSTYELLRTWSMICRGVKDSPKIRESRHLYTYDDELNERSKFIHGIIENKPRPAPVPCKTTKLVYASIDVQRFKAFKDKVNSELAPAWVSSDDLMVCLGWRAFVRARRLKPTDITRLVRIVDVRKKNRPPLPQTAFGNGVFVAVAGPLTVEKLLGLSIAELSQLLRSRVDAMDAAAVRDCLTACSKLTMVSHPSDGSTMPFSNDNYSSSYAKFIPANINFQHSPALTVTRACHVEGIITPQPIVKGVYSCKMAIDSTQAEDFVKDPDLLKVGFTLKL